MGEVIKTSEQIEDIFRLVVLSILKLDSDAPENQKRVRFPWGSSLMKSSNSSAPGWKKNEDVCVIYTLPQDDFYIRQRDRKYIDDGGRDMLEIDEHTDVHFINFVNYGSNAYECARDIRDGLFAQKTRQILKRHNFSLSSDVPSIKRVPELYAGEWWNRVDFSAVFYEYVRRENAVNAIEQVPLHVAAVSGNGKDISQSSIIAKKEGSQTNG